MTSIGRAVYIYNGTTRGKDERSRVDTSNLGSFLLPVVEFNLSQGNLQLTFGAIAQAVATATAAELALADLLSFQPATRVTLLRLP